MLNVFLQIIQANSIADSIALKCIAFYYAKSINFFFLKHTGFGTGFEGIRDNLEGGGNKKFNVRARVS